LRSLTGGSEAGPMVVHIFKAELCERRRLNDGCPLQRHHSRMNLDRLW